MVLHLDARPREYFFPTDVVNVSRGERLVLGVVAEIAGFNEML